MNESDENTALGIVLSNTNRKNRTLDLITIAKSFKKLEEGYGSRKAVAEKVGLSNEMIRQFISALTLEKDVQNMISERKIDSVDVISELSKIKKPEDQIATAIEIQNMNSKDARDILRFMRGYKVSIKNAKNEIMKSKNSKKFDDMHVFVIDFNDEERKIILKLSARKKVKPADLIKQIVLNELEDWRKEGIS
jgi:hypothetical protein